MTVDVVDVVVEAVVEAVVDVVVDVVVEAVVDVEVTVDVVVDVGAALNNATTVPGELTVMFVVADDEFVKVMLEFVSHPTNS